MVLFLDVLAFSVVIPVLPNLILSMVDGDAGRAAFLQGMASSLDGTLKFFMQPLLGRISDGIGRKPVLAYSLVGSAISFGIYVVAPSVPSLFISHALHGISQCTFVIVMSAVADVEHDPDDPSSLTHSYGLIGVALGVAFVLGPVVGGALAAVLGYRAIYAISTFLFCLTFWALRVFMHETLDEVHRRPFRWSEAVPLRAALGIVSKSRGLALLSFAYLLCSFTVGVYGLWILYAKVRYGYGTLMAGVLMSLNGLIVVVAQGLVIRVLIPKYAKEGTVAVVSYAAHAVLFLLVGLATSGEWMLVSVVLFGLPSALGEPAIKSVMSHLVSKEEQGAFQGAMGSVYVLAQVFSPVIYSWIFRESLSEESRLAHPWPCPAGMDAEATSTLENVIRSNLSGGEGVPVCGGLPGTPFFVQAGVFLVASVIMRYALKMVERDAGHEKLSSNGGHRPLDGSLGSTDLLEGAEEEAMAMQEEEEEAEGEDDEEEARRRTREAKRRVGAAVVSGSSSPKRQSLVVEMRGGAGGNGGGDQGQFFPRPSTTAPTNTLAATTTTSSSISAMKKNKKNKKKQVAPGAGEEESVDLLDVSTSITDTLSPVQGN